MGFDVHVIESCGHLWKDSKNDHRGVRNIGAVKGESEKLSRFCCSHDDVFTKKQRITGQLFGDKSIISDIFRFGFVVFLRSLFVLEHVVVGGHFDQRLDYVEDLVARLEIGRFHIFDIVSGFSEEVVHFRVADKIDVCFTHMDIKVDG